MDQKIKQVSPTRRKKIESRAAQLLAEDLSLRELHRAHKLTQERIAETLGIGEDQVSRLGTAQCSSDFHTPELCGSHGRPAHAYRGIS